MHITPRKRGDNRHTFVRLTANRREWLFRPP